MWIYTRDGFYSIVEDRLNPDVLLVRSWVRGVLESLFPDCVVEETPRDDYAYRTRLPRAEVALAIGKSILSINYENDQIKGGNLTTFSVGRLVLRCSMIWRSR